jgi:hypothetical protein
MTASAVSICSNALLELGGKSINAFTEDSDAARLASNLWDQVRRGVLRGHPWNCATKRVVLAPVVGAPAFGYAFAFTQPPDCMKIVQVGLYGAEDDYAIESGQILAGVNPLYLRYIWDNDNPATYDEGLVEALTAAMAARMAYAITGSTSLRQAAEQRAEVVMARAQAIDGQDEPPQTWGNFHLLASRRHRMV